MNLMLDKTCQQETVLPEGRKREIRAGWALLGKKFPLFPLLIAPRSPVYKGDRFRQIGN